MEEVCYPNAETGLVIDRLAGSLGFLTRVVHIQINERIRASGALGVSPATLAMLSLVSDNPGIRQAQASRVLLIHDSNMAILVKRLIQEGSIERRGEGKRSGLWIAAKGAELLAQAPSADEVNRSHAATLSDKEYQQLVALLRRVYLAGI